MLSNFWLAMATAEKASFSSNLAIWPMSRPARLSAIGMARAGATGKSIGVVAASANDTIRASGVSECSSIFSCEARIRAEAPSLSVEALSECLSTVLQLFDKL